MRRPPPPKIYDDGGQPPQAGFPDQPARPYRRPFRHPNALETLLTLSDCIAELLKSKDLSAMAQAARSLAAPAATPDEANALYGALPGRIAANDRRAAVASVLALLRLDGDAWLSRMRRDGIFRASRHGYDGACLKKVVVAALELAETAPLSAQGVQYLASVQALLVLSGPARQIHKGIVDRLKARKGTALKTLLAIVNATFALDWPGDAGLDESSLMHWSCTDLASAFSRLYMISRDELGIGARTWIWTDDLAGSAYEGTYASLLVDAARLNELIDAEVLLDGLPYKAEITAAGVLVSAIDPDFERSIRLGYVQADLQLLVRAVASHQALGGEQPKLPSFPDELSKFFSAGLLECVSLRPHPIERFVIALPQLPPLIDLLNYDGPFLEEFALLQGAFIDNFQPAQKALLQVSEHLSIMDLFKAQRLFNLIDAMFREKLLTVQDEAKRRVLALRSTVMVAARADLQRMLETVMSQEKAQELISLLSLAAAVSTAGANVYVDLQYRPFVHSLNPAGDYIAIPPAIVGKSNLVRSVMHGSRIKGATAAADDPMQVAVAAAFRQAGFLVRESFHFNIDGKRETDIFCCRDGVLFVIECKNAYHPCSPHELRNSHDLILKAEEQLDIRARWLADPGNQSRLFQALGWDVAPPARVRTCVVTANRAFSGYRCGAHPVRQAHELINVLLRGYVGTGPGRTPRRFWRAEAFEVADLISYLDGQSVLHMQHAAMSASTRSIAFKERRLEFAQFTMDLEGATRLMEASFEPMPGSGAPGDAVAEEPATAADRA